MALRVARGWGGGDSWRDPQGEEEEAAAGHFPRRKRCRIFPRCG